MSQETVTITVERLKELEALEASLPTIIEAAKRDHDRERLAKLRASETKEEHSKRILAAYHAKKEEINARRRAAYKAKKEASSKQT